MTISLLYNGHRLNWAYSKVCVLQESEQNQAFPANTDNKAFYI